MHTNSVIELNPDSYQNNLLFLKKMYGKNVILSSVVKGNAYGHGIEEFVTLAHKCGVAHFSVFDVAEAQRVLHPVVGPVAIAWQAVDVELEPGLLRRLLQQHGDVHRAGGSWGSDQRHADVFHAGFLQQESGFFRVVDSLRQVGVVIARTRRDRPL